MGAVCKTVGLAYAGSNPAPATMKSQVRPGPGAVPTWVSERSATPLALTALPRSCRSSAGLSR